MAFSASRAPALCLSGGPDCQGAGRRRSRPTVQPENRHALGKCSILYSIYDLHSRLPSLRCRIQRPIYRRRFIGGHDSGSIEGIEQQWHGKEDLRSLLVRREMESQNQLHPIHGNTDRNKKSAHTPGRRRTGQLPAPRHRFRPSDLWPRVHISRNNEGSQGQRETLAKLYWFQDLNIKLKQWLVGTLSISTHTRARFQQEIHQPPAKDTECRPPLRN